MNEREQIIWGIHAGRLGEADNLFLKKKVIAIGWHELGDSSSSGRDRGKNRGQTFILGVLSL